MSVYYKNKKTGLPSTQQASLSACWVVGFTLIELLVSISIVTVILTVVIINQSTYTDRVVLTSLADEIGLTISQTQAYSMGVKQFSTGVGEQIFSASYGLSFSLLDPGSNSGSDVAYINFADLNENNAYDGDWLCQTGGGEGECLSKIDISRGSRIESICVISNLDIDLCQDVARVDINFVRPSTEAQIQFFDGNGQSFNPVNMKGVRIILEGPSGATTSVAVYKSGQVSANPPLLVEEVIPSCTGIYSCDQWDGTSGSECTGNGRNCSWVWWGGQCNGGIQQCSTFSEVECTPVACTWQ